MGVPVYKRILELLRGRGHQHAVRHSRPELRAHVPRGGEARLDGGRAAPRGRRRLHGRGRVAHHRQARRVHRHARPGHRQCGAAPCSARWWRIRRSSSSAASAPASPSSACAAAASSSSSRMPLFENSVKYAASIEYADQTDEIIREAIRKSMSGTPGPSYIEYPAPRDHWKSSTCRSRCRPRAIVWSTRARMATGRRGREAHPRRQEPDPAGRPRRSHLAQPAPRSRNWPS